MFRNRDSPNLSNEVNLIFTVLQAQHSNSNLKLSVIQKLMKRIIENLPKIVKAAREKAYYGLYVESLKQFEVALELIRKLVARVNTFLQDRQKKSVNDNLLR